MENLLLNIDFNQSAKNNAQKKATVKNRDKYKQNKQKIINRKIERY